METRTKKHNPHARFYKVFSRMTGADKSAIVETYSNGATQSLAEFLQRTPGEYYRMCADLEAKFTMQQTDVKASRGEQSKERQRARTSSQDVKDKRSAILKRMQKMGIDTTDWSKVNAFLMQPKIAGKLLYQMSIDEMQALIPKLESILQKDRIKQGK